MWPIDTVFSNLSCDILNHELPSLFPVSIHDLFKTIPLWLDEISINLQRLKSQETSYCWWKILRKKICYLIEKWRKIIGSINQKSTGLEVYYLIKWILFFKIKSKIVYTFDHFHSEKCWNRDFFHCIVTARLKGNFGGNELCIRKLNVEMKYIQSLNSIDIYFKSTYGKSKC